MVVTHLPAAWTSYLNELAFFRRPARETLESFAQSLRDARSWHHFESAYWVSQAEKQGLARLEAVLAQMETCQDLQKLLPWAFEAMQLMEGVQAERERSAYSPDPLINDMVLCGACTLQGQALERAISERIPRVQAWEKRVRQDFEAMRPLLPGDARRDLEVAFAHFSQAVVELGQANSLKKGMSRLLETSELLRVLPERRRKAREQQLQPFRRWSALPMVGAGLEQGFEELVRLDPSGRAVLWAEVMGPLWLELFRWWGQQRELLPLPTNFLCDWIPQVDQDLAELADFEPGQAMAERTLSDLKNRVEALAGRFAEASALMGQVGHLRAGAAVHYYELIQGLLRNTLPLPAVALLFQPGNPPEAWKGVVERLLLEYSQGGPRELLYQARQELLRLVPAPAVPDSPGWSWPVSLERLTGSG